MLGMCCDLPASTRFATTSSSSSGSRSGSPSARPWKLLAWISLMHWQDTESVVWNTLLSFLLNAETSSPGFSEAGTATRSLVGYEDLDENVHPMGQIEESAGLQRRKRNPKYLLEKETRRETSYS